MKSCKASNNLRVHFAVSERMKTKKKKKKMGVVYKVDGNHAFTMKFYIKQLIDLSC